jgi:RND family efflux transporter MFP subunit
MERSFGFKASVVAAGLAALGLGLYAGRAQLVGLLPAASPARSASAERPAQPVRVTAAVFVAVQASRSFTGTVRPQHETAMAFRVAGKIVARMVDVGDAVTAGQVLARLDDADARLSLATAEAEVSAAQTDLARATSEADRSKGLYSQGHVTKAALDAVISTKAQAQGRMDRALHQRDQAAHALDYTVLVADAAGVVTAVTAEAGQVVAAGQGVATVARTDAQDVVFALPEQMRPAVEKASATAKVWDDAAGQTYALTLRDISPDVDPVTRTYRVRMALQASDRALALGRTMTVTLAGAASAPVVYLPLAAVMNDGQGASVWRLDAQETSVQRVPVEIAALTEGLAEVRGLAQGDMIVSLGAQKIDPARPVRVVETAKVPAM